MFDVFSGVTTCPDVGHNGTIFSSTVDIDVDVANHTGFVVTSDGAEIFTLIELLPTPRKTNLFVETPGCITPAVSFIHASEPDGSGSDVVLVKRLTRVPDMLPAVPPVLCA